MNVPLSAPDITDSEIEAVVAVLRSSRLSLGPKLEEFEYRMTEYTGAPYAVAVSSGTAGLHLCVRALGIGAGDEVILPSFTFISTANAVRYEGAVPVFVDIDPVTLNLDPGKVEDAITARTRAIMLVHTFGYPAEIAAVQEIARRHNLRIIEDACEAIGAEYHGGKVGAFGDAGVFAFYPNKQITTGEGGMLVTQDESIAKKARALRNQGRYDSEDWFQHAELGYNYRISEINCALGIEQLKRIEEILCSRERVAREYSRCLSGSPALILPVLDGPYRRISWFVYVVRLAEGFSQTMRNAICGKLIDRKIGCGRYFAPIHLQPSYAPWRDSILPVTEFNAARTIALPFFNRLTLAQIEHVVASLQEALVST